MATDDAELESLVRELQITSIHSGSSTSEAEAEVSSNWRLSIFAKVLLNDNRVRFKSFQNTFLRLWKQFGVLSISTVSSRSDIFLIVFDSIDGMEHVLEGGPWLFQNDFVLLERVRPNIPVADYVFDKISLWIQLHGLPLNLLNPKVACNLLNGMGIIYPIDPLTALKWTSFARVKVQLHTGFKIKSFATSKLSSGAHISAKLCYEKLARFCHICCSVGHEDITCHMRLKILKALPSIANEELKNHLILSIHPKITDSVKDGFFLFKDNSENLHTGSSTNYNATDTSNLLSSVRGKSIVPGIYSLQKEVESGDNSVLANNFIVYLIQKEAVM